MNVHLGIVTDPYYGPQLEIEIELDGRIEKSSISIEQLAKALNEIGDKTR
jgi:hypothetical protein